MKVLSNPYATKDNGTRVDVGACPCIDLVSCGWQIEVTDPTTYTGLSLNGKVVDRPVSPADGVELVEFVLEDLATAGGYDFGDLTYVGATLKYDASAQLIPDYIAVNGFNIVPDKLCNTVKYCTYKGAGTALSVVEVDGVAATEATFDGDDTWTVIAPTGSVVTVDGINSELCDCAITRYEA